MDYLCLAVKKEAARSQTGSREQAREWFFEKFGDHVRGKLEKEKKKLEGRVRSYDRKAETHKGGAGRTGGMAKTQNGGSKGAGMCKTSVGGRMGPASGLELRR